MAPTEESAAELQAQQNAKALMAEMRSQFDFAKIKQEMGDDPDVVLLHTKLDSLLVASAETQRAIKEIVVNWNAAINGLNVLEQRLYAIEASLKVSGLR